MNKFPLVSVLMPVRNEAAFIERSLGAVLSQDYPASRMEVIVADGMSSDRTRDIVRSLGERHANLRLIDNPDQIVPTGLNAAIRQAKGEIIIRVDGHTEIATDYVRQCIAELQRTGADNVGGKMTAIGKGAFGEAVALATSSPFGVGGAQFHYSDREAWVDTVYLGAWPRQVFERIGLFDEELVRDQDDEFNYRLLEHGGHILLSPRIRSVYTARSRPGILWRQYFHYGLWKVRVMQKHPAQMRLRQFIPPAFAAGLLGSAVWAAKFSSGIVVLALVGGSYILASLGATLWIARKSGWHYLSLLPVVFGIIHVSYGLGFLIGLIKFRDRWGHRSTPTGATVNSEQL